MNGSRRLAVVRVTPQTLIDLCKSDKPRYLRVVSNPLPADAQVRNVGHDRYGYLNIVIASESFADVPAGEELPQLSATEFQIVRYEGGRSE